jgi:hypothetical protein
MQAHCLAKVGHFKALVPLDGRATNINRTDLEGISYCKQLRPSFQSHESFGDAQEQDLDIFGVDDQGSF